MSHIDDTERNRIREQYGELMSEEEKEHFPTAQEQALKEYEEDKERGWWEVAFNAALLYFGPNFELSMSAILISLYISQLSGISLRFYLVLACILYAIVVTWFRRRSMMDIDKYKETCVRTIIILSIALSLVLQMYSFSVMLLLGMLIPAFFVSLFFDRPLILRNPIERVENLWGKLIDNMVDTDTSRNSEIAEFNKVQSWLILFFFYLFSVGLIFLVTLYDVWYLYAPLYLLTVYLIIVMQSRGVSKLIKDKDQLRYMIQKSNVTGVATFVFGCFGFFALSFLDAAVGSLQRAGETALICIVCLCVPNFIVAEVSIAYAMNKLNELKNKEEVS